MTSDLHLLVIARGQSRRAPRPRASIGLRQFRPSAVDCGRARSVAATRCSSGSEHPTRSTVLNRNNPHTGGAKVRAKVFVRRRKRLACISGGGRLLVIRREELLVLLQQWQDLGLLSFMLTFSPRRLALNFRFSIWFLSF